ncbi:hypothetical protein SLEP1_g10561 [Rubroshorea leprosula]|uniref:DUF4283 domain-containing protein n=1 Tax=Rubroshorea leprosula TaxID=152421 RepID=A0AAV5IHX1_9ROSI|nr:hypothetical protein SLEP1_g10561 [Rubroshorea leprosula]
MRWPERTATSDGDKGSGGGYQGSVVDVFVSNKRDKWGKRFGFVRMVGVMNEYQMEKRLNEIWFGFYKLRVRIADRPLKQSLRYVKKQNHEKVVTEKEKDMVQVDIAPEQIIQLDKNEEVGSCDKKKRQKGTVGSIGEQTQEAIIDFSLMEEELHWLEGSLVVILKSLMSTTSIQERIDVDGGLITISPLGGEQCLAFPQRSRLVWLRITGVPLKAWSDRCFTLIEGTVGEVVLVHDDTKNKSFLCEGRVLVLCTDASKIAKSVQLQIEGQLYEVGVLEEEWRSDPDWWLSDGDRRSYIGASSEYSVSQNGDEDHEFNIDEICVEEDDSIDLEQFQMEGSLNSNNKEITGHEESGVKGRIAQNMDDGGIVDSNGLVKGKGLVVDNGLGVSSTEVDKNCKSIGPNDKDLEEAARDKVSKEVMGKRLRHLVDCYPQEVKETREEHAIWVTGRTKQRRARRVKV